MNALDVITTVYVAVLYSFFLIDFDGCELIAAAGISSFKLD